MKVGTVASIVTYTYARSMADGQLDGRLTLAVVSDEETFGPNGTRHLFDVCPEEITGTAVLVGEPSSRHTVRLGEKGMLWLRFKVETHGGHGAYVHMGPSAVDQASTVIADLRKFAEFDFQEPPSIVAALIEAGETYDRAFGRGASENARRVTMNVGRINAGTNVNMIASQCTFEVDFRLPMGVVIKDALDHIEKLRETHCFSYDIMMSSEPNWTEPNHEFVEIVAKNAETIAGAPPQLIPGLGSTDARLWRNRGIPAVVYGPAPRGMGATDEHVPVEEIFDVVRCHLLSAFDYLSTNDKQSRDHTHLQSDSPRRDRMAAEWHPNRGGRARCLARARSTRDCRWVPDHIRGSVNPMVPKAHTASQEHATLKVHFYRPLARGALMSTSIFHQALGHLVEQSEGARA
ncbi:M20/M25/M40 family metallo-hydrolase [Bradyrhizobium lupini]|uniref:M20/M25/M40 family metallo-hydrolase n=1 Tax=Rhizobium lupini TaxID=136996 RepID=UPI0034C6B93E